MKNLILFLLLIVYPLWGQTLLSTKNKKAIELYQQADNFRVRRQYAQAVDLLLQALEKDRRFEEAYFRLGITWKAMHDYRKANEILLKGLELVSDEKKKKAFYFELGDNFLRVGNYNQSLQFLNLYLQSELLNKARLEQAQLWKRNAEYGLKHSKDASGYEAKPLSDSINAFTMQYFPVLTADEQEMIFTRRLGTKDEHDEDLVISKRKEDGTWSKPTSLSEKINSAYNEGTCAISADGRTLIFTSCLGRKGYGNCDLFLSRKNGEEWTAPVNMGPQVNSAAWESQPSLSADGRTLYFVSDRRGGEGNRDIYFAYLLDDGKWTKAENMGDIINTPFDEISPFIHANGRTLYFTSNGRPGFGGYDIYKSERENGQWGDPENYGSPVNTYEDQFSFFITANGEKGYYSHEEGFNQNATKIYEVVIPEEMREKHRGGVVRGIVRDKRTKNLLKASVELFDLAAGELVAKVSSDSVSGRYMMVLPEGFEYALYVSKPGYLFQSLHFNDEQQGPDAVVIDIDLEPVKAGASMILNNIFFETDKYDLKPNSLTELNKVVRFLKESTSVKIEIAGHTDNVGAEDYNKQLSLKRANAVAEYLIRSGVKEEQVTQKGYGASNPIRPNDSDVNRGFNRRIEIRVINN